MSSTRKETPAANLRATLLTIALALAAAPCVAGCDNERKEDCDKFLAIMKPLDEGTPTADAVERVQKDVAALKLRDQALGVYAKNYAGTLTVLAGTLRLNEGPSAPDGTNDVIKAKLKEARTDKADTVRYCAK
jgi:hypothetical protein